MMVAIGRAHLPGRWEATPGPLRTESCPGLRFSSGPLEFLDGDSSLDEPRHRPASPNGPAHRVGQP